MKIQTPVKQETKKILIGEAALSAVMLLVFIALGRFDMSVVWGTLLGGSYAVFNFFLMALTVQMAAAKMEGVRLPDDEFDEDGNVKPREEVPQQKAARALVQKSYTLRLFLTAIVAIIAIKVPLFNAIPAIVALFFPRIVITVYGLIQKNRKGE